MEMTYSKIIFSVEDNGGRRLGIDRRRFSYDSHIPERRSGSERRNKRDRRSGRDRKTDDFIEALSGDSNRNRRRFENGRAQV